MFHIFNTRRYLQLHSLSDAVYNMALILQLIFYVFSELNFDSEIYEADSYSAPGIHSKWNLIENLYLRFETLEFILVEVLNVII